MALAAVPTLGDFLLQQRDVSFALAQDVRLRARIDSDAVESHLGVAADRESVVARLVRL